MSETANFNILDLFDQEPLYQQQHTSASLAEESLQASSLSRGEGSSTLGSTALPRGLQDYIAGMC